MISYRRPSIFIAILVLVTALSCSSDKSTYSDQAEGNFTLSVSENTIRSYPGGGGISVIKLVPDPIFNDIAKISVAADPVLNAVLTDSTISTSFPIIELTITPAATEVDTSLVVVNCTCMNLNHKDTITVILYDVTGSVPSRFDDALDDFIVWLGTQDNDYIELGAMNFDAYRADMGYVGSTCWTYWNSAWEIRLCSPSILEEIYNMRIRYRGEFDFRLAARRNADGTIESVPL